MPTTSSVSHQLQQFGLLRLLLLGFAVLLLVLLPLPGALTTLSGWGLVRTVLVPVMMPIVFMVLLLDVLMARVFASDATPAQRRQLKIIAIANLLGALALLVRWLPYFLALQV
ncbi:MAG: hypothetical protein HY308_06805 [Gammaproteobacteria bacterium]|nr:hypothetical protein [Gammaproteobacteria bacterium]